MLSESESSDRRASLGDRGETDALAALGVEACIESGADNVLEACAGEDDGDSSRGFLPVPALPFLFLSCDGEVLPSSSSTFSLFKRDAAWRIAFSDDCLSAGCTRVDTKSKHERGDF